MRRLLTSAILLLYPRWIRKRHGPEIATLIDDLIAHEGHSGVKLFTRLALDGLVQRIASTATVWTAVAVLAATSFAGLAVSDLAAASARQAVPRNVQHRDAPARPAHHTPHQPPTPQRPWHRPAEDGPATSVRFPPRR